MKARRWSLGVIVAFACLVSTSRADGASTPNAADTTIAALKDAIAHRQEAVFNALASTPVDRALLRRALHDIGHVWAVYRGKELEKPVEGAWTISISGKEYLRADVQLDRAEGGEAPREWIKALTGPLREGSVLVRTRLAIEPRPEVRTERDRLLAEADGRIRTGLHELANEFPQLRITNRGTLEEKTSRRSPAGQIRFWAAHYHGGKAGTSEPVAERDRYSILLFLKPLRWREPAEQLAMDQRYPGLGLTGRIGTAAGDAKLDATLKELVRGALAPLADLAKKARIQWLAEEQKRTAAE